MPSLGEAFIEVHADTGPFDRELAASIEKALIAAEATMRSRGRDAGNAFGEGVASSVDDHVKRIGDKMSDGLTDAAKNAGKKAATAIGDGLNSVNIDFAKEFEITIPIGEADKNTLRQRERELTSWAKRVSNSMASAFSTTGGFLNLFTNAVEKFSDIQVLFNPAVLAAAFGMLGGLILGLIYLLAPITALIAVIPAALLGFGASVLVFSAALSGLYNSIAKIFGATTLDKALELTTKFAGGTRAFLEGLAYFSQLWRDIVSVVQVSFFLPFTDSLKLLSQLLSRGEILAGIRDLAYAMGKFTDAVIRTFASREFQSLMKNLFPAIARIVDQLSGPFARFLRGMFEFIEATLPFFERLSEAVGRAFQKVGDWLSRIANDGSLDKFLTDMEETLGIIYTILSNTLDLLVTFIDTLRKTGVGDSFLKTIAHVLDRLNVFFQSENGKEAIVSMTEAAMGLIVVLGALVVSLSLMWLWMTKVADNALWFVKTVWGAIEWVGKKIADFFIWLAGGTAAQVADLAASVVMAKTLLVSAWNSASSAIREKLKDIASLVATLPLRIGNALVSLPYTLYLAGWDMMHGFVRGIIDSVPYLTDVLNWITGMIPNWKGPESVDKKLLVNSGFQVMQGFREGIAKGAQGVFSDLQAITAMIGVNANANSFTFGPGSIVQNFSGDVNASTGRTVGTATGSSIASTVNQQNMRAAVRAV